MHSLLLVGIVLLVFSLFRSRGRFVFIYNMSARELYLWWLMRLILTVLVSVILYLLFPDIVSSAKTFILTLAQFIRSFVTSLAGY